MTERLWKRPAVDIVAGLQSGDEADLLRSAAWLEAELGALLAEPIDPAVSV